ncbi:MAG: anti-sigma factor family protein [Candidatus Hydrogenedentales bacterium]|jgi:hypothetical protein
MDTEHLNERLSSLLDGELPENERQELEALIASNPAVAREWHALKQMDRLFRGMPRHDAPDDLTARLRAPRTVRRTVSFGRPRSSRRSAWPLLAAAAAFVLVFGLFLLRIPKPDPITLTRLDSVPAESASRQVVQRGEQAYDAAAEKQAPSREFADEVWGSFEIIPQKESLAPMAAPEAAAGMRRRDDAVQMQAEEVPAPAAVPYLSLGQGSGKDFAGGAVPGAKSPLGRAATAGNATHLERKPDTAADRPQESSEPDYAAAITQRETVPPPPAPPAPLARPAPSAAAPIAPPPPAAAGPIAPAPEGVSAETLDVSGTQRIGGRIFQLRDTTWIQDGYTEQTTALIERDSDEWAALIAADPTLAAIRQFQEAVLFESAGAWYRIPPVAVDEPSDTPAQP